VKAFGLECAGQNDYLGNRTSLAPCDGALEVGELPAPAFFYLDFSDFRVGTMEDRASVDAEMESRVHELGYELVELLWGGKSDRPIIRMRIDVPDSSPGQGVTVQDCARVSRALEGWLDELQGFPERYQLEVSSPGIERPLHRLRDFRRFSGEEVRLKLSRPLGDLGKLIEARLQGVVEVETGEEDAAELILQIGDRTPVRIRRGDVVKAQLIYRWDDAG
jgi:ribosome maturation factor RimP